MRDQATQEQIEKQVRHAWRRDLRKCDREISRRKKQMVVIRANHKKIPPRTFVPIISGLLNRIQLLQNQRDFVLENMKRRGITIGTKKTTS